MAQQAHTERADWRIIVAVTFAIGAFSLAKSLSYPLIAFELSAMGASGFMIGLNAAAFMAGLVVSNLVMPWMTARCSARWLIVTALFGAGAVMASLPLTASFMVWFLLRFILGFLVNTLFVMGESWLNVAAEDRTRGRAVALYSAIFSGGFAIGPLGVAIWGVGEPMLFYGIGAFIALVGVMFWLMSLAPHRVPAPMPKGSLLPFAKANPMLVVLIAVFALADALMMGIMPVILVAEGITVETAAMFISVFTFGMILVQPLLGVLIDRFDKEWLATVSLVVAAAAFIAMAVLPFDQWTFWVAGAVSGGAIFALFTIGMAILGATHKGGDLVTGSAVFSLVYGACGMVSPPVGGALMDVSTQAPVLLLAGITLAAAGWMIGRRPRQSGSMDSLLSGGQ